MPGAYSHLSLSKIKLNCIQDSTLFLLGKDLACSFCSTSKKAFFFLLGAC